jgi:CHRD domain
MGARDDRAMRAPIFCIALIGALSAPAARASIILTANLTNAQENPPTTPTLSTGGPRPASFGTAMFVINDAMTEMTFTATVFNIDVTGTQTSDPNDNLIAAHIHAPAPTPTTNASVVWGFFGSPFNAVPGSIVMTPFTTGVGGTFSGVWLQSQGNGTTLSAQLPSILSGQSYINFHTTQYGSGEIRGAILAEVPEPGSLLFAASALLLFGVRRARRS